jgi:hypothetical protein
MIVDNGANDIATQYIAVNYTKVKVGSGGDPTNATQPALDSYVAEKVITPSVIGTSILWNVEFSGSDLGNEGVSELGIFHATTDTLLSRVAFTNTGVLASADTLTFTVRMEMI